MSASYEILSSFIQSFLDVLKLSDTRECGGGGQHATAHLSIV